MHTLRTKLRYGIRAEFLPPSRSTKRTKVVIMCDGVPTVPQKKTLLEFFAKKGYWVFHPRYRGTWESEGKFMQHSPASDVIAVIDSIETGFVDYWNNKLYKLKPDQIILVGSSFGGAAAILASEDHRVNKALVFSPLINWKKPGQGEPLHKLEYFMAQGFGEAYRPAKNIWNKIRTGKFFNPINVSKTINGNKLTLVHAKDDDVCPYRQTRLFSDKSKSRLITLSHGGHLGLSTILKPRFTKILQQITK